MTRDADPVTSSDDAGMPRGRHADAGMPGGPHTGMPGGPHTGMPGGRHAGRVDRRAVLGGLLGAAGLLAASGCGPATGAGGPSGTGASPSGTAGGAHSPSTPAAPSSKAPRPTATRPATAAEIVHREIPVLCWHQLRDWKPSDTGYSRSLLICPPATFRAQLTALAEDGWSTIGADDYLAHLTTGAPLPPKPVLLTFDDSQGSQLTVGLPQLKAHGMTATFFVMTVVLGNPGWFTRGDVARLVAEGMTVGAHTWDHHRVDQYTGTDWARQLQQPRELLEKLSGTPVEHFAYPYGAWNQAALPHVRAAGYRTGFQLADRRPSPTMPIYTLRRSLVDSRWTGPQLLQHLAA